jgi:hypothetical protein
MGIPELCHVSRVSFLYYLYLYVPIHPSILDVLSLLFRIFFLDKVYILLSRRLVRSRIARASGLTDGVSPQEMSYNHGCFLSTHCAGFLCKIVPCLIKHSGSHLHLFLILLKNDLCMPYGCSSLTLL